MSRKTSTLVLIVFWLAVGAAFVSVALTQRDTLNLSATAGGQFPYLAEAQRMAEQGRMAYWGDRNRMPLYPMILSLVHNPSWDVFVARSSLFAISSSVAMLVALGAVAYARLARWSAALFVLVTTWLIFLPKSSFVQAELLYYVLLFLFWVCSCGVFTRGSVRRGLLVGGLGGIAFLTKASGLLMIAALLAVLSTQAVVGFLRSRGAGVEYPPETQNRRSPRTAIAALIGVIVGFLVVSGPYLADNHARFGHAFYNVNSRFFMWCDSWSEAKQFSDQYAISEHYPDAPAEAIPGAAGYLRSHTWRGIAGRLRAGLGTLWRLGADHAAFQYVALLAAAGCTIGFLQRKSVARLLRRTPYETVFTAASMLGYLAAYAWYAQIAYGDRFLLSLFLPLFFLSLVLLERGMDTWRTGRRPHRMASATVWCVLLGGSFRPALGAIPEALTAYPEFVRFYLNESKERERAGDWAEAYRGYQGVIRLDPRWPDGYHAAGMVDLRLNRIGYALGRLAHAATLDGSNADILNSYGSALIQAGKEQKAIEVLIRAVELKPRFAPAWFNLGGAYVRSGRLREAEGVLRKLRQVDSGLSRSLQLMLWDATKREPTGEADSESATVP